MKIDKRLWSGGIILILAFGIYNFFNFVFQLSMARMLSISDYGIFATLFAIIYILAVFVETIQTVITKYSSEENDKKKLKNILRKSLRKSFFISLLFFMLYLVISIPLGLLLKINYYLLAFNGLMIFTSLVLPVTRGIMQGKKRFKGLGINMISESVIKLTLAIMFVYVGSRVYGAIGGAILGTGLAFFLSFIPLRDIIKTQEKKAKTIGIYSYAKPTFLITFIIIVFYSIDIIIAKIVFSEQLARTYAIASILSKAIFWGTQPISRVMFPLSSENVKKLRKSNNVFLNSLVILFMGLIGSLTVFYFLPEFIIKIFAGRVINEAASILFFLGIGTSLISITNLIMLYKLSINETKGYPYLLIFLAIEIFLLFYCSDYFYFPLYR